MKHTEFKRTAGAAIGKMTLLPPTAADPNGRYVFTPAGADPRGEYKARGDAKTLIVPAARGAEIRTKLTVEQVGDASLCVLSSEDVPGAPTFADLPVAHMPPLVRLGDMRGASPGHHPDQLLFTPPPPPPPPPAAPLANAWNVDIAAGRPHAAPWPFDLYLLGTSPLKATVGGSLVYNQEAGAVMTSKAHWKMLADMPDAAEIPYAPSGRVGARVLCGVRITKCNAHTMPTVVSVGALTADSDGKSASAETLRPRAHTVPVVPGQAVDCNDGRGEVIFDGQALMLSNGWSPRIIPLASFSRGHLRMLEVVPGCIAVPAPTTADTGIEPSKDGSSLTAIEVLVHLVRHLVMVWYDKFDFDTRRYLASNPAVRDMIESKKAAVAGGSAWTTSAIAHLAIDHLGMTGPRDWFIVRTAAIAEVLVSIEKLSHVDELVVTRGRIGVYAKPARTVPAEALAKRAAYSTCLQSKVDAIADMHVAVEFALSSDVFWRYGNVVHADGGRHDAYVGGRVSEHASGGDAEPSDVAAEAGDEEGAATEADSDEQLYKMYQAELAKQAEAAPAPMGDSAASYGATARSTW